MTLLSLAAGPLAALLPVLAGIALIIAGARPAPTPVPVPVRRRRSPR
jgi:hypothetical protein